MSSIDIDQDFDTIAANLSARLSGELPPGHDVRVGSGADPDQTPNWRVTFRCVDRSDAWVGGACPADQVPLFSALARATLREMARDRELAQSQQCMNQYAVQVTQDFEVLTWLRNLATQFEFCDVRNSMAEVATRVLPGLRSILGAAAIQYIPADRDAAAAGVDSSQWVLDGPELLNPIQCRDLVRRYSADPNSIVVLNSNGFGINAADSATIRNCLIARLGNDQERFGTIVALNRSPEVLRDLTEDELAIGVEEFGTVEAGLLQSVVTMFVTHGRNLDLVREKDALLVEAIRSLIRAIDAKDAYTFGHSDRVALFGKRLAIEMGLNAQRCDEIYTTGLLHDIGKIGVPDSVLGKPGRLTDEEFELIKQHPMHGYEILRDLRHLSYALDGVLHHHEHYDGTGYPKRLAGEDIPLFGRILAVADAYDAMTSDRPYRNGMPTAKAENILRGGAGTQWDPKVVDAMMAAISDIHAIAQSHGLPADDADRSLLPHQSICQENRFDGYETALDSQPA